MSGSTIQPKIPGTEVHKGEVVCKNRQQVLIKKYTNQDGKRCIEAYDNKNQLTRRDTYGITDGDGTYMSVFDAKKQTTTNMFKENGTNKLLDITGGD